MSATVLTSLISLLGVIVSAIISAITSLSLVNWRLNQLEDKVDKHNAWGEKFQQQTTDIAVIQKDIEYIKEKIDGK